MTSLSSLTRPVFRPAAERFHSRLDWLDSWHSFSFSNHYDPAWMGFGPLRVINDDTIAAGRGFGMHPHNDMEIVTVMVEGELSHRDSMGNGEVLRAGEVQRMSAGTGVVHSEINQSERPCRLLQIWIEPSHRGIPPAYEQKPFSPSEDWTLLIDPSREAGAMAIDRPLRLWRAQPGAGQRLVLPQEEGHHYWLQLINGAGRLDPSDGAPGSLERGDGYGFASGRNGGDGALFGLTALDQGADLLLFELD
ncbi:pirin-like bicupin family protein [Cyanobium sp. Morenito 9A2]|uniref:pirin family protein n=1 Tax=Cyanobium sp. Morenito 9A2 TaxID=2823718 RepID=UPI0020CDAFF9|nr:pirin-like bicupin family protein [Cyanobium sp. Morenito 9A2]MCP9850359.1 pirin family protein [Cyanobium sp. Morenito 9A2]